MRWVGAQPAAAEAPGAAAASHDLFISLPLLKSQLFALDHGLKGVVSAVGGTTNQQYAESVEKNLALLMSACDANAADYETLKNQISKAGAGLEAALAAGPAVQGRAPRRKRRPALARKIRSTPNRRSPLLRPRPNPPSRRRQRKPHPANELFDRRLRMRRFHSSKRICKRGSVLKKTCLLAPLLVRPAIVVGNWLAGSCEPLFRDSRCC